MVKNLIDKIANHQPKHFIAPVMSRKAKIFAIQDDIPYWFYTEVEYPNWYYLKPNKARGKSQRKAKAISVRQANPHEYIDYLGVLPAFQVIALFPISDTVWLVMPYNLSDATQRGWKEGTPRPMHLTMDNILSMDVVTARLLAPRTLIFDHLSNLSIARREKEIAQGIFDRRLDAVRKQEALEARADELQTEEGRLKESLKFMGAELEEWTREIDGYIVRWKIDGQVYRTQIDTNMRVVSAGVCLNGTDDWHSLTSIIEVMQDRAGAISRDEHGDW